LQSSRGFFGSGNLATTQRDAHVCSSDGLKTVSPRDLHRLVQDERVIVIDVNARQSWLQARIGGAVDLDPAGFVDRDLPADRDSTLVYYCSNRFCRKAPQAARRATAMGTATCW
jgi:rhodanese-related sulfurtransferase